MNGKSKCKILKDIRRQIARENDIALVISECKYQGDCSGTCPKCEAEVRYLEQELRKRQQAGKAIAVAGIAAALVVSSAGCAVSQTGGSPLPTTTYSENEMVDGELLPPGAAIYPPETTVTEYEWMGNLVPPETTLPDEPLMGEPLPPEDMGEIPDSTKTTAPEVDLMGDLVG